MTDLGTFTSTAYGPPWDSMQGTGVTSGGTDLRPAKPAYIVAVDPAVIPLGSRLRITPNPFNYSGAFLADDTGGAIKGKRIDFYDWRGRSSQTSWGVRSVQVATDAGAPVAHPAGGAASASGTVSAIAASGGGGGGLFSSSQRSGALRALVWVLLIIGGAGLAIGGGLRLFGATAGGKP